MADKPLCTLAHRYSNQDVIGWLMSEKLDGVRALWDTKQLKTRTGKVINAPQWFLNSLPQISLDGELWIGRGQFQKTVGIVRKKFTIDKEWRLVRYMVFDVPRYHFPFKERMDLLLSLLPFGGICQVVKQQEITTLESLTQYYNVVIKRGGEGLILRQPDRLYEYCRSKYLLKYVPTITDEAIVTDYKEGEGKYTGLLGALVCFWKDREIEIGTGFTDEDRRVPPPVGARVTFEYRELTDGGMPRFPVFICERNYE